MLNTILQLFLGLLIFPKLRKFLVKFVVALAKLIYFFLHRALSLKEADEVVLCLIQAHKDALTEQAHNIEALDSLLVVSIYHLLPLAHLLVIINLVDTLK